MSSRTLASLLVLAGALGACGDDEEPSTRYIDADVPDAARSSDAATDASRADSGSGADGDAGQTIDAGSFDAGVDAGDPLPRATAAALASQSADSYADNRYGLITGSTLASYVANWTAQRPAGVTGKLVILQVVPSAAGSLSHVAGKAGSVVSYLVPQSELTQLRNNGLSKIEAEIPDGASVDALLKKYGIDVKNDYVALTFEQLPAVGSAAATPNSIVQQVGRAWLLLRYWGYPKERVGILNGSVNWNAAQQRLVLSTDLADAAPGTGTSSVRDLRVDATELVITLDSLLAILKGDRSGVRVIDARGGAEALGLLKATSTGKTDCPSYTNSGANTRCSPLFEGRIKGASSVPWTQFIDTSANGFRYLDKAQAKALFDAQSGYQAGQTAIQYCRTNVRSMVTGIVSGVVLGYPTRFYDTSFIEWSHLAYGPTAKTRTLPESSAYRTDLVSLTEHALVTGYTPGLPYDATTQTITGWQDGPNYNADADISDTPVTLVPNTTTASQSVTDDRAYKLSGTP